ncbi:MAG: tryptophan synthase subunit beta, partial [Synergistales bacterium]|nr:tryptophan synthase subunit beta [Synergistales bacterium]
SSHALAHVYRSAGSLPKDSIVLANLSGRGDKDMDTILSLLQGK